MLDYCSEFVIARNHLELGVGGEGAPGRARTPGFESLLLLTRAGAWASPSSVEWGLPVPPGEWV